MKKSSIIFLMLVSFSMTSLMAQNSINDYKYVIVPNQYDFLSDPDQFRLNTLTKFLLKKYNFNAFMKDEPYPDDLANKSCLALIANVVKTSSILKSKLTLELRDCQNNTVFVSDIGESRLKEYKKAYHEALRNAFKSLEAVNYTYKPLKKEVAVHEVQVTEVKKKLKAEPKKQIAKLVEKTSSQSKINKTEATSEDIKSSVKVIDKKIFAAQKIDNGYRLIDNSSNETITIFDSGVPNVFIVKGKDAIIYKKENKWIYSETNETSLLTKLIDIKF